MMAYAAMFSFALQRQCVSMSVVKALDLAQAQEKTAAFAVLFFSRLLSEASDALLREIFGQLGGKGGTGSGANEAVLAVEIFFQRHMRAAAAGDDGLMERVRRVLGMCRDVALEA